MLRSFRYLLVFIVLITAACQKEIGVDSLSPTPGTGPGPVTPPVTANAALKMKIGGTQWLADKGGQASILAGFITIEGLSADRKYLSILLDDTIPKTYTLNQTSLSSAELADSTDQNGSVYSTDQGTSAANAGGTVVVTGIDKVRKTISGTFQFRMFRNSDGKQKVITEGSFDKIPYISSLPPAAVTDTFQVKIDNVNWSGGSISTGMTSTGELFISASELNVSRSVNFFIPASIAPGSYDLVPTSAYFAIYNPDLNTFLVAQSGKLVILEHNLTTKRIRGSFDFKAVETGGTKTAVLSQGYFSLKHQ